MQKQEIYDITIIGGGPTGLFAAFYAGMRNARTKLIESLPELGGQLAMLYPEKKIYDIAGFPEIRAQQLIQNLTAQLQRFDQTYCLEEEVKSIEAIEDGLLKITSNKASHYTKSIIITAGNGAFQPRRISIEGAEIVENKSLHYYITDTNEFANQDIAICGGGDSAIDWALMLEPIAKSVTLIHRRPEFRAHEHSVSLLSQSTIQIKTPFILDRLYHDAQQISAIKLKNPKENIEEILPVDQLIVNYGFSSSIGPLKDWPLEFEKNSIKVNSDMSTSMPGVYAAGDICTYAGKVKLIATGFGEAPTAVNNALHYIQPKTRTQPVHSTSLFQK